MLLLADGWAPPRALLEPTFVVKPGSRGFETLTPRAEVLLVARSEPGSRSSLVSSFVPRASLCGAAPGLVEVDDTAPAAGFALIGDWERTGMGILY